MMLVMDFIENSYKSDRISMDYLRNMWKIVLYVWMNISRVVEDYSGRVKIDKFLLNKSL